MRRTPPPRWSPSWRCPGAPRARAPRTSAGRRPRAAAGLCARFYAGVREACLSLAEQWCCCITARPVHARTRVAASAVFVHMWWPPAWGHAMAFVAEAKAQAWAVAQVAGPAAHVAVRVRRADVGHRVRGRQAGRHHRRRRVRDRRGEALTHASYCRDHAVAGSEACLLRCLALHGCARCQGCGAPAGGRGFLAGCELGVVLLDESACSRLRGAPVDNCWSGLAGFSASMLNSDCGCSLAGRGLRAFG